MIICFPRFSSMSESEHESQTKIVTRESKHDSLRNSGNELERKCGQNNRRGVQGRKHVIVRGHLRIS